MTTHDTFTKIASERLGIETLEVRGRDALDFQEVGVASLKDALDAAYRAGQNDLRGLLEAAQALLDAKDTQMLTGLEWRRWRRVVRRAHKQIS